MPIARIGYGTDFILKDQGVGIATDTADIKLKVGGTTKANYNITGIASLTNYAGFSAAEQNIAGVTTVTGEHSTLGDIVVGVGSVLNVSTGATVCTGSVESISITGHFAPPCGGVQDRQECPVEGTVRFNKDLNTLEFYNGVEWRQFTISGKRGRGIYCGGTTTGSDHISNNEFIEIATQGNAQNFGDLSVSRDGSSRGTTSSAIRGLSMAGYISPAVSDVIDYLTIASEGNSIDFGNSSQGRGWGAGMSSSTRGISAGGYSGGGVNTIDYVEIMTLGNALDFGDLPTVKESTVAMASPTRGIIGTGMLGGTTTTTTEYLTIASKGNAVVFGDADAIRGLGAAANTTRGLFAGGKGPDQQNLNLIYKITIASTGSQTEFGTLATGARKPEGVSNSTRACFAGGENAPGGRITTIQSVNFSSGGTAEFFGDLAVARQAGNSNSDSHGGLGGY
jgi:hypothetical protein